MGLDSALSIATSGLSNINARYATIAQNVANANTPGYLREVSTQQAVTSDGISLGVHTGKTVLQVDLALQSWSLRQNATVANLETTQTALQAIDTSLGTPGSGADIGSLLGKLQDGFSTLLTNPASTPQQSAVVSAAAALAQGINSLSAAYTTQRQGAQDDLVSAVDTLNSTLATIGQLSDRITALGPTSLSTADLENQRNAAVQTLSKLVDIKTTVQPNGDLSVITTSGMSLPTHQGTSGGNLPFSIAGGNALPGSFYPGGGLPGIMLGSVDVTKQLQGGRIGADVTLRDTTLPTYQAELDEFAYGLSSRFAAQGLTLFTRPNGTVPAGGGTQTQSTYVGYAGAIQVNPAVTVNPALVRDGTTAIAGSSAGASAFTPNPTTGPAGFTTMINRVLTYTFGSEVQQNGALQPAMTTTGLGADGTLAAPFAAPPTLAGYATDLVAAQSQVSSTISTDLTNEQAVQTSLNEKISTISGVNMDTEMSQMIALQTAYSANARIIAAVQSMYNQLMQVVQ
ncbi:MAG: flagellar hook-associated protein FlgK [Rhodopila sp.]